MSFPLLYCNWYRVLFAPPSGPSLLRSQTGVPFHDALSG